MGKRIVIHFNNNTKSEIINAVLEILEKEIRIFVGARIAHLRRAAGYPAMEIVNKGKTIYEKACIFLKVRYNISTLIA